jgi:hypothetical protein
MAILSSIGIPGSCIGLGGLVSCTNKVSMIF